MGWIAKLCRQKCVACATTTESRPHTEPGFCQHQAQPDLSRCTTDGMPDTATKSTPMLTPMTGRIWPATQRICSHALLAMPMCQAGMNRQRQGADLQEQGGQEGQQRRIGLVAQAARARCAPRSHQQRLQAAHAAMSHLQRPHACFAHSQAEQSPPWMCCSPGDAHECSAPVKVEACWWVHSCLVWVSEESRTISRKRGGKFILCVMQGLAKACKAGSHIYRHEQARDIETPACSVRHSHPLLLQFCPSRYTDVSKALALAHCKPCYTDMVRHGC